VFLDSEISLVPDIYQENLSFIEFLRVVVAPTSGDRLTSGYI
jgi:hypothetical protein